MSLPLSSELKIDHDFMYRGAEAANANFALRTGIVLKAHSPDAETNRSKKVWEYDVQVFHRERGSMSSSVIINNCVLLNSFGGIRDHGSWNLKVSSTTVEELIKSGGHDFDKLILDSTVVYVLCLNGRSTQGVIIGHPQHPSYHKQWTYDHYHWHRQQHEFYVDHLETTWWNNTTPDAGQNTSVHSIIKMDSGGGIKSTSVQGDSIEVKDGRVALNASATGAAAGVVTVLAPKSMMVATPLLEVAGAITAPSLVIGGQPAAAPGLSGGNLVFNGTPENPSWAAPPPANLTYPPLRSTPNFESTLKQFIETTGRLGITLAAVSTELQADPVMATMLPSTRGTLVSLALIGQALGPLANSLSLLVEESKAKKFQTE